ncbi:hypothetical protein COU57_01180 [Candidatus Pacearchaeota archaeon CG10_big_fil_rev_8_21_14_0_10_32_14]|nr:MAG: hypothetical protein COU57_01180 [Candidatus Pacearchaeota archaeon CG10_big_fil_rev_8_21_14_0_10_32_14]
MTNEIEIKKKNMYIFLIIVLLVGGGAYFVFANGSSNSNPPNTNNPTPTNGDVQNVVLSFKNYNYYPQEVRVKANQPVRISLDKSVSGCLRSFTIKEFGVARNLPTPSDYVEFTPTKTGRFRFACSMGMGTGTLIVE